MGKVLAAEAVEQRLRTSGIYQPTGKGFDAWVDELIDQGVIQAEEGAALREAREATRAAIGVDDFPRHQGVTAARDEAA